MSINSILEFTPFVIWAVFSSPRNDPSSRTADKIASFSTLGDGWHYGSGKAISPQVLRTLACLNQETLRFGIDETDVFPGRDGDVTFAVYRGEEDFSFRVQEQGEIEFDSESQELPVTAPMSLADALACLKKLAAQKSWKSFSSYISDTTILERDDSGAWLSEIPVMGAGYRSSGMTVPSKNLAAFAPMPVISIRRLPQNLRSIGSLNPPFFQKVAA